MVDILNLSPTPVTIYHSEKVACFQPMHEVCVATEMHNDRPTTFSQADTDQLVNSLMSSVEGLSQDEEKSLRTLLYKFSGIFSQSDDDIGRTNLVRHSIDTGSTTPIKQAPRRLPFHLRGEVKQMLDNMETRGIIEPASGPWAAPIVMVKKKDNSWRLCVDYRNLNQVTKKDAHPLPRIDDTLDQLSGAHWFSTLDLASGYWQVEMEPADKEKTAFSTPFGLFQFNVMPFGLCNAPSTFQRLMEMVLAGLHWSICLVYIDDVIVYGRTCQEHLTRLEEVFERLQHAGLKMKPSKCYLLQKRVRYLGHVLSENGVETDPEKISCIKNWPVPTNVEELRRFLGIATYYRRFVHQFARIAAPLHHLTNKGSAFYWSQECNDAFSTLKQKLSSAPVLCFPQFDREFIVDTDASDTGLGAVLSQVIEDEERVVAYASRTLTKAERQYATTRKEMLALVWALKHLRPYLYGRKFTARTDHKSLAWLQSFKHPEGQVARWLQTLAEFQFVVEHRPGVHHSNADALSRRSDGHRRDALNVSTISSTDDIWLPQWTKEELLTAQQEDPDLKIVLQWMKTKMPSDFPRHVSRTVQTLWTQRQQLLLVDGVLYREWLDLPGNGSNKRLQMLLPHQLIFDVLKSLHDHPTSAHLGITKTLMKVRHWFYWPGQRRDVEDWCRSCIECASRKSPPQHYRAKLQTDITGNPLQRIAMDILGPLPVTTIGNKYVLVISDYFTKWADALPLPNMEAETVAREFVRHFVCVFGAPTYLHTDQGRNFDSKLIKEVCHLLGIIKTRTTAYHPQSDGLVEQLNRTLLSMLGTLPSENEDSWDLLLPMVMLAYRTSVQETTGATPYSLMFGREARLPADIMFGLPPGQTASSPNDYALNLRQRLEQSYHTVRARTGLKQDRQKELYDLKAHGSPFKIDDKVWLNCPAVPRAKHKKFHCFWQGPFVVKKKISDVLYQIQQENSSRKQIVHFDRLKPCWSRHADNGASLPPSTTDYPADEEESDLEDFMQQNHANSLPQDSDTTSTDHDTISASSESETMDESSSDEQQQPSVPAPVLRRSTRARQPSRKYRDYVPH